MKNARKINKKNTIFFYKLTQQKYLANLFKIVTSFLDIRCPPKNTYIKNIQKMPIRTRPSKLKTQIKKQKNKLIRINRSESLTENILIYKRQTNEL